MPKEINLDINAAIEELKAGKPITGKDGVLGPLIKHLTEAALEAEAESHIRNDVVPNRKNGKSKKTIKSSAGKFELETPRDRAGTFEPRLIRKNQTTVGDEIEEKILSMYSVGLSYRDIANQVEDLYGIEVSTATISAITDKIFDEVKQWQQRPLDPIYPFVWLDAIHYKVKENRSYQQKAVYTVLGLNMEGKKEVLGLYIAQSEGARFWLSVLSDLQNRGIENILIASVDGLSGFPEAIESIFPKTEVQLCIVHQVMLPKKEKTRSRSSLELVLPGLMQKAATTSDLMPCQLTARLSCCHQKKLRNNNHLVLQGVSGLPAFSGLNN